MEKLYTVYMVAQSVKKSLFTDTLKHCKDFCNAENWEYKIGGHGYVWDLEID